MFSCKGLFLFTSNNIKRPFGLLFLGAMIGCLPLQAEEVPNFPRNSSENWIEIENICLDLVAVFISENTLDKARSLNLTSTTDLNGDNIVEEKSNASNIERVSIEGVDPEGNASLLASKDYFNAASLKGSLTATEFMDHFIPFLFRTKKSEAIGKVDVIININKKGKLTGYELVSEVDKGLEQRLNYVLRKMPDWIPAMDRGENVPMNFLVSIEIQ